MANQNINKVIYGDQTLIDLTADTVKPSKLLAGFTAHDASGSAITGTAKKGYKFFDVKEFTPTADVQTYTVTYDNTKNVALVVCYDPNRSNTPGAYAMTSIYFYNFFVNSGSGKYGTLTNYQGSEAANASYGYCAIDTANGTITVGGHSANYKFKANRKYRVCIFYDVPETYTMLLNLLGGTALRDSDPDGLPSIEVDIGDPFEDEIIVPNSHFTIRTVSVLMGGTDITASVYDASTHKVNIPAVNAPVTINATAANDYLAALCDGVLFEQYNSSAPAEYGGGMYNSGFIAASVQNSGLRVIIPLKTPFTGGKSIWLRADDISTIGDDDCWTVQAYFYNQNQQQIGSNTDFITASSVNKDINDLVNGRSGWVSSNITNAYYIALVLRSNGGITQQSGVIMYNLRVQLTQNE